MGAIRRYLLPRRIENTGLTRALKINNGDQIDYLDSLSFTAQNNPYTRQAVNYQSNPFLTAVLSHREALGHIANTQHQFSQQRMRLRYDIAEQRSLIADQTNAQDPNLVAAEQFEADLVALQSAKSNSLMGDHQRLVYTQNSMTSNLRNPEMSFPPPVSELLITLERLTLVVQQIQEVIDFETVEFVKEQQGWKQPEHNGPFCVMERHPTVSGMVDQAMALSDYARFTLHQVQTQIENGITPGRTGLDRESKETLAKHYVEVLEFGAGVLPQLELNYDQFKTGVLADRLTCRDSFIKAPPPPLLENATNLTAPEIYNDFGRVKRYMPSAFFGQTEALVAEQAAYKTSPMRNFGSQVWTVIKSNFGRQSVGGPSGYAIPDVNVSPPRNRTQTQPTTQTTQGLPGAGTQTRGTPTQGLPGPGNPPPPGPTPSGGLPGGPTNFYGNPSGPSTPRPGPGGLGR